MNAPGNWPLSLNEDELAILTELLEAARTELLVEIHHTHHRNFRDYLRKRLNVLEGLLERVGQRTQAAA